MKGWELLLFTGIVWLIAPKEGTGQAIPIRYSFPSPVSGEVHSVNKFIEDFGDSTGIDTIYQSLSKENVPVNYFRKIKTSVCFDGKCRLLDIVVYWDPTGGYQGFDLPPGEFLSKTDHDPFTHAEYLKLHTILSDSLSPLADYTFEELVPGTGNPNDVDAVSSATLKDILDYIVPGAAYTTYRLWHLVYGKTRDVISGLSDQLYTEKFALELFESGRTPAQLWSLARLHKLPEWSEMLTERVLSLTESPNLNISATALANIAGSALEKPVVQRELVKQIQSGEYALKKTAIQKFSEASVLDKSVIAPLVQLVPDLNGDLLGELLTVFQEKKVTDVNTLRKVSAVLESGNRYKGGKVLEFLEKQGSKDSLVIKRMRAYQAGR